MLIQNILKQNYSTIYDEHKHKQSKSAHLYPKTPISNSIKEDINFIVNDFNLFYNFILKQNEHNKALILKEIKLPINKIIPSNTNKSLSLSSIMSLDSSPDAKINYLFLQKALKAIQKHIDEVKNVNSYQNKNKHNESQSPTNKPRNTLKLKRNSFCYYSKDYLSIYSNNDNSINSIDYNTINNHKMQQKVFSVINQRQSNSHSQYQSLSKKNIIDKTALMPNISLHSFYNRLNDVKGRYSDYFLRIRINHMETFNKKYTKTTQIDLKEYYNRIKAVKKRLTLSFMKPNRLLIK